VLHEELSESRQLAEKRLRVQRPQPLQATDCSVLVQIAGSQPSEFGVFSGCGVAVSQALDVLTVSQGFS
jgi:hypothetical protein